MDWSAIALAAKRANAAYITGGEPSKAAFEGLGDVWSDIYSDANNQAVISVDSAGAAHLTISGTRASSLMLGDVFDDLSLEPCKVKGGTVTSGVISGMQDVWDWALSIVPDSAAINIAGHSLGASRAHLTPLFIPAARIGAIHSFEAPKFLGADFYAAYANELANMVCVLNGRDTWAAWPWIDSRWQARPKVEHIWLKDRGGFTIIPASKWPGAGCFTDHSMGLVAQRVEALASLTQEPACCLTAGAGV